MLYNRLRHSLCSGLTGLISFLGIFSDDVKRCFKFFTSIPYLVA